VPAFVKNVHQFNNSAFGGYDGIFKDKQQKGKIAHFTSNDFENRRHRPKACERHPSLLKHARTKENVTTSDELVDPLKA